EQVRNAVSAANANRPKGAVSGSGNTWVIHTNDQLFKAHEYRGLIVSSRDGKPVILSEVATVQDSVENSNSAGSVNGKPAISLVGTFGVMLLLGYSLDNLSLMALTISTGFVIDDAIVVIENITRHLEHGMKPLEAALRGAREIGFTVFSMSTSLIAVFIPI